MTHELSVRRKRGASDGESAASFCANLLSSLVSFFVVKK